MLRSVWGKGLRSIAPFTHLVAKRRNLLYLLCDHDLICGGGERAHAPRELRIDTVVMQSKRKGGVDRDWPRSDRPPVSASSLSLQLVSSRMNSPKSN